MKCFTGNSICYTMLYNIKTLLPRFFESKMKCFVRNSICCTKLYSIKTLLPRFFGSRIEKKGFDIFCLFFVLARGRFDFINKHFVKISGSVYFLVPLLLKFSLDSSKGAPEYFYGLGGSSTILIPSFRGRWREQRKDAYGIDCVNRVISSTSSIKRFLCIRGGIRRGQNSKVQTRNVTWTLRGGGVNHWTIRNPFCVFVITKLCEK